MNIDELLYTLDTLASLDASDVDGNLFDVLYGESAWHAESIVDTANEAAKAIRELKQRLQVTVDACTKMQEQRDQLATQLKDATRQCGVLAELLREAHPCVSYMINRIGPGDVLSHLNLIYERIDDALAGKAQEPVVPDALVALSDIASLQRYTIATIGVVDGKDYGAEMEQDDEGEYVLLAEALMLADAPKPEGGGFDSEKVRKVGGSFQHTGTVVSRFSTLAGEPRIVLEFDAPVAGMLHVYRPDQVEPLEGGA